MSQATSMFRPRLAARRRRGKAFAALCVAMSLVGVVVLGTLLFRIVQDGGSRLSVDFLRNGPSHINPGKSGIKPALIGTLWVIAITGLTAIPLGVAAAVYLEEYAGPSRLNHFIQVNIANLAGVPSVVYGMLGLAVFVRGWHVQIAGYNVGWSFGRSVLAGGLTLALLILPVIIIASREALAAVPRSIRLAAYALGATRWQVVRHHVVPAALPGIMTGVILALSRAIGEAAPLMLIGAVTFVRMVPTSPLDAFTALPLQIYSWIQEADSAFHELAATAILVLLAVLLSMNAIAVGIRMWHQRSKAW